MYRRHLLSIDHVQQLLYHQVLSDTNTERRTLRAPAFFMSQGDRGFKGYFFSSWKRGYEMNFVLWTIVDNSYPWAIRTFIVLTHHFSEKFLCDIIKEEDQYTPVTLLEYLKHSHLVEWDNLVKDAKILAGRRTRSMVRTHSVAGFNRELCTRVHTMHSYLGFSSCTDTLPNCFWYDELCKGH